MKNPKKARSVRRLLAFGSIGVAIALTAAALPQAKSLVIDLSPSRLLVAGDPDELFRLEIEEAFHSTWSPIVLLLESDRPILDAASVEALHRLGNELEELPGVRRVVHPANVEVAVADGNDIEVREILYPLPENGSTLESVREEATEHRLLRRRVLSGDGHAAAVVVEIDDFDAAGNRELVAKVRAAAAEQLPPSFRLHWSGFPVVQTDYFNLMGRSRAKLSPVVLSLIVVTLAWSFRSLVGVLVPVLAVALAIIWTFALMATLELPITLLGAMVPTLVALIGVASSVHLLAGFGEAAAAGAERWEAIRCMIRREGLACLLAVLTTAVGFASLASARINLIREYGISVAMGVVCALVATLLLLPALLYFSRRPAQPPRPTGRLEQALGRLVRFITARAGAVTIVAAVLVSLFALGALRVENNEFVGGEVDSEHPLETAIGLLDSQFAGTGGFLVSVRSRNGDLLEPSVLERIAAFQRYIEADARVRHSLSYVDYLSDMNRVFHEGNPAFERPPDSRALAAQYMLMLEGGSGIDELDRVLSFDRTWAVIEVGVQDVGSQALLGLHEQTRRYLREQPFPGAVEARLGGRGIVYPKASIQAVDDLMASFAIAFVVIFGILLAMLRSFRLAVIAMIPNIVPSIICLGYMGAMGVNLRLGTAVCFSAVLGIAVDDTIHFLLRFRRERRYADVREACERTVKTVGRPILLTTVILASGLIVYSLSPFDTQRQLGILNAVALIAAVIADLALLPALLVTFAGSDGRAVRAP